MVKKYYNIEVLDEEKIRNLKWFIYSGLYPYNEFKIDSSLKFIINDSILNNQSKLHPWFRLEAMKRGYLPMDYFYVIQEKIPWLEKVEKN